MAPIPFKHRPLAALAAIAILAMTAGTSLAVAQTPVHGTTLTAPTAHKAQRRSRSARQWHRDRRHELARAHALPSSPATSSDLLFDGRTINDYEELQAAPGAITEVPDPIGGGEKVLDMTVNDHDVAPITPTENPRAQAVGPAIIETGDEVWLSTKFMIPDNYPSIPGWLSLVSFYGPPFEGSSPWHIGVTENELRWQRNGTYDWDIPWKAPMIKGEWVTVLLHERFASDGWVEMWIDGEQIDFFPKGNFNPHHEAETTRLDMQTEDASNDGGANSPRIAQYREEGMFSSASLYFGDTRVGTTWASVEG